MKIKVAIIFGGESVEHEISIISAHQAIEAIDKIKYEVIPVYIAKDNRWYTGDILFDLAKFKDLEFIKTNATEVKLITDKSRYFLYEYPFKFLTKKPIAEFDIAFPIVHGTNVEDGTLQGLLQANKIPYVGPGVSAGAVGQDKVLMKLIWQASTLPVLPYVWCYAKQWESMKPQYVEKLIAELGFPMIVKPANLGSSIGISVAKNEEELILAVDDAAKYDEKIIVERALTDFTEINCSVLGTSIHAKASVLEKVYGTKAFLTFEDKYQGGSSKMDKLNNGLKIGAIATKSANGMARTNRQIPAELGADMTLLIQNISELAFKTLGMSGVSRIDFMLDNQTNKVYLNEINTIPGSLSFYLWQASGVSFSELLDQLIKIAIENFKIREKQTFTYDSNVLSNQNTGIKTKM
ncbi:MAG: D-alanine--D-alanine ligase family protein [Culicoidibacterales bacterium]